MAIVQVVSDLHLEFHRPASQKRLIEEIHEPGVDVLVIAGDLCTLDRLAWALGHFCRLYPHVVYVLGNHEFYGSSVGGVLQEMAWITQQLPNLHWLDNSIVKVAGVRFIGGTLWFTKPKNALRSEWVLRMNDHRMIKGLEPWAHEQNQACVELLQQVLPTDVVVTHYMPSEVCVSPWYKGSPLNHFFVHDLTPLIEERGPALWAYGHTHDRATHVVGKTLLVGNPLGYPGEREHEARGRFSSSLTIEVPAPSKP